MSNYPTFDDAEHYESANVYTTGLVVDRVANGDARARDLGNVKKLSFGLVYPALKTADLATLKTFYLNNRDIDITFSSEYAGSVTVRFSGPPSWIKVASGLYNVSVGLVEQ